MAPLVEATRSIRLSVLVVDDEPSIRRTLAMFLEDGGHGVRSVSNVDDAVSETGRQAFDLALVDLRLGTASGMDLIPRLLALQPSLRIVMITAFASVDTAVEAMRRGAFDYLPKPFTPGQVEAVVRRVAEVRFLEQQVQAFQRDGQRDAPDLRTKNAEMQRALDLAREVAASDATVLLRGESGSGKGVVARAIHGWSPRSKKAFTTVSCPSLSPELLESEMFGHVKGAFTGAVRDQAGRVAAAEGGTLFLDEIGELPSRIQPKLLRFLQDREYERVGDQETRRADVRVIAATNADLDSAVRAGSFREDLFYRLNVFQIELPPLRRRVEDIQMLAESFLARLRPGPRPTGFAAAALEALRTYAWPGNVRELRNVVERAVILCKLEEIGVEQLPAVMAGGPIEAGAVAVGDHVTLEKLEEAHVRRVLGTTRTLEEAALALGIDVATLWRKRKKYGI